MNAMNAMHAFMRPVQISRWQLGNPSFNPMPSFRLSEGRMSAPAVSPAALSALQKAAGNIIESLQREIQAVQEEFDLASPAAIRVDPKSAQDISFIGPLPPQEIRSALSVSARELSGLADRVLSGALSHYISSGQAQSLSGLKGQADQLVSMLESQDMAPITSADQAAVQSHLSMHTADISSRIQAAEKAVVEAEAGAVPVIEPMEKGFSKIQVVAGIGVAAGLGILLYSLLS